jgi:glycosyltransferase involved in cell wall biosynthesis
MGAPKLTIYVPAYNRPQFLREALQSLCMQGLDSCDYRVVVSDDASPTSLGRVTAEFQDRLPIKYIRNEKNLGHIGNFAMALEYADSDLLSILTHDDVVSPGHFPALLRLVEPETVFAAGLVVCCSWPGAPDSQVHGMTVLRDGDEGMMNPYRWQAAEWQAAALMGTPYSTVGAIFRTSAFSECRLWQEYALWHDRVWCAEIGLRGAVLTVPWVAGLYRVAEEQLSRALWESHAHEFKKASSVILANSEAAGLKVTEFWIETLCNSAFQRRAHFFRKLYQSLEYSDFLAIKNGFERRAKQRARLGGRLSSVGLPWRVEMALRSALRR